MTLLQSISADNLLAEKIMVWTTRRSKTWSSLAYQHVQERSCLLYCCSVKSFTIISVLQHKYLDLLSCIWPTGDWFWPAVALKPLSGRTVFCVIGSFTLELGIEQTVCSCLLPGQERSSQGGLVLECSLSCESYKGRIDTHFLNLILTSWFGN